MHIFYIYRAYMNFTHQTMARSKTQTHLWQMMIWPQWVYSKRSAVGSKVNFQRGVLKMIWQTAILMRI